jgi:hypothetical protein
MYNDSYEMHELQDAVRKIREVDAAPLVERKKACAAFLDAMKNRPETVGERVGWLIDGNYGYGEMKKAHQVLGMSARANKAAQLTHLIGVFEWNCPAKMAVAGWKKLSASEKAALDRAVKAEIADYDRKKAAGEV